MRNGSKDLGLNPAGCKIVTLVAIGTKYLATGRDRLATLIDITFDWLARSTYTRLSLFFFLCSLNLRWQHFFSHKHFFKYIIFLRLMKRKVGLENVVNNKKQVEKKYSITNMYIAHRFLNDDRRWRYPSFDDAESIWWISK